MTEQKTRHVPNYKLRFVLLIIAALLCILISFSVGRFPVSLADVIMVFATEIFKLDIAWDFATWSTVINIRLPRILAAFFVGAALATAGAAYQGMFQNPLVSPDILGASSGAGFGAALAIFMNLGPVWITAFAFAGAVICVGAAYIVTSCSVLPPRGMIPPPFLAAMLSSTSAASLEGWPFLSSAQPSCRGSPFLL